MDDGQQRGNLSRFYRNLLGGYRLATGRRIGVDDFVFSLEQLIWLALLIAFLDIGSSYLKTDSPAVFNYYGINYLAAIYLLTLIVLAYCVRIGKGRLGEYGRVIMAYFFALPLISLVADLVGGAKLSFAETLTGAWVVFGVLFVWELYLIGRILHLYIEMTRARLAFAVVVYAVLMVGSLWVFPNTPLFYTDEPLVQENPYADLYARLNVEDTFYAQQGLMDESILALAEQRPGATDLYFLAVGGYGLEKVFLKEVEYVREMFDSRYDTRNRSLILVNNLDTVATYPMANRHNLAGALGAMAARMDTEEDILFLFMTSHGSDKHDFSLSYGPVRLNDIRPEHLKEELDKAGIRWRVIIVSSCYSGGFVEPLLDEHTLIITAAAKDRKSFGCGANSEFTDFGKAYFKHALTEGYDFIEAYDTAAQWVADKEKREQREASLPQISIGEAIKKKLAVLYAEPSFEAAQAGVSPGLATCAEGAVTASCR